MKEQTALDRAIQDAIQGWSIPIMSLTAIKTAAMEAAGEGRDVTAAVEQALIDCGANRV